MKDLHRSGDPFKHRNYLEYKEFYDDSIVGLPGAFFSSAGDLVLPVENFGNFPWDSVNVLDTNTWSMSAGGHPLHSDEWTLCQFVQKGKDNHPLLVQYRWIMPNSLVGLLQRRYQDGRNDIAIEIRNLIGASRA